MTDHPMPASQRVPGHFDPDLPEDFTSYYPAGRTTRRITDPALLAAAQVAGDTGWGPHPGWLHPYFAEMNPADVATMLAAFEVGESELVEKMKYFCGGDSMFGLWLMHLDGIARRSSGLGVEEVLPWDFATVYELGMPIARAGENALADSRYGFTAVAIFDLRRQQGRFEVGDQERYDRLTGLLHLLRGGSAGEEPNDDSGRPAAEWALIDEALADVDVESMSEADAAELVARVRGEIRSTGAAERVSPHDTSALPQDLNSGSSGPADVVGPEVLEEPTRPGLPVLPPLPGLHGRPGAGPGASRDGGEKR